MLEVKVGKGDVEEMTIRGNFSEITLDAFCLLHTMYRELKKANEDVGKGFRDAITENIDEIFDGPEAVVDKLMADALSAKDEDPSLDELENKLLEHLGDLPQSLKEKMLKVLGGIDGDEHK